MAVGVAQPKRFELTRNDISSNEVRLTMLTNEPKYLGFKFIANSDELLVPDANLAINAHNLWGSIMVQAAILIDLSPSPSLQQTFAYLFMVTNL